MVNQISKIARRHGRFARTGGDGDLSISSPASNEASGSIWEHLAASGSIWEHVVASASIWKHLGASGNIWEHLETSGNIWEHLEASGSIWEHLEASGNIWEHLGVIWESSGSHLGVQRLHLGVIWRRRSEIAHFHRKNYDFHKKREKSHLFFRLFA